MSCGFKYKNLLFADRKELVDYLSTGKKPPYEVSLQQLKNDIVKKFLNMSDAKAGVSGIVKMFPDYNSNDINIVKDVVGSIDNLGPEFYRYVNGQSENKNTLKPLFDRVSDYFYDLVSAAQIYSSVDGVEKIPVSEPILNFYQKLVNESSRLRKDAGRGPNTGGSGVFENEEGKWFIPGRENSQRSQGSDTTNGETQRGQNEIVNAGDNAGSGNFQIGPDNSKSTGDTIKSAGSINGHPERIRISTGDYVSWSDSRGEWSSIVKRSSSDRYGVVRPANDIERNMAEETYRSMYYGPDYDPNEVKSPMEKSESMVSSAPVYNSLSNELKGLFSANRKAFDKIFEMLDFYNDGGYYFSKKDDVTVSPVINVSVFNSKGKETPEGRHALLNFKNPVYTGTSEYAEFLSESKSKKIPIVEVAIDQGYDVIINDNKSTIQVLEPDALIYEEEIIDNVSRAYLMDRAEYDRTPLTDIVDYYIGVDREDSVVDDIQEAEPELAQRHEQLKNMIFNSGMSPLQSLSMMVRSGFIEMAPAKLYSFFQTEFNSNNVTYDDVVLEMGFDLFPPVEPAMLSATGIDNYDILPKEVVVPQLMDLFNSMGFSKSYSDLFSSIYDTIPRGYDKVKTALKIGLEMLYPEKTGMGILNYLPLTKEERYSIEEKYGNVDGKMQDVFMNEMLSDGQKPFWFSRSLMMISAFVNKAKETGMRLPIQYESFYKLTRDKNPIFEIGDYLLGMGNKYSVFNVDYSQPDNIHYQLRGPDNNFVMVDSKNIDQFELLNVFENKKLEKAKEDVIKSLSQIGTKVVVRNPLDFYSPVSGIKETAAYYDIMNNELNISSDDKDALSLYHEAAHAVFIRGLRISKDNMISFHRQISNVLANGTEGERKLHSLLNELISKYTIEDAQSLRMGFDEMLGHEYFAQLISILARGEKEITVQSQKSIIDRIIQWFRDVFGWTKPFDINNTEDLIGFINGIARKLRTGETINFQEYASIMEDESLYSEGKLYSRSVGLGVLKPGEKYPITGADGRISFRRVFITGEVDGVPFIQFDDSPTRYVSNDMSVVPIKGFCDKYGIVLHATSSVYDNTPSGIKSGDDFISMAKEDLSRTKDDGSFVYTPMQVFKKYKDIDALDNMNFSQFMMIVDAVRNKKAPEAPPAPSPLPKPPVPVMPNPIDEKPVSPSEKEELDSLSSLLKRINNFDIDENTIRRWMNSNETPEYFTNMSELGSYISGESIEKYTGEPPKNDQTYIKFQLATGAEIADNILADLKAIYPGDQYIQKTLELLESSANSMVGTALMHAALERDLIGRKVEEIDNHRNLTNLQKIVHQKSQAYIRNVSNALNARKTAYDLVNGSVKPSDVEKLVLPKPYVKTKKKLEDATNNDDVNEVADEVVVPEPRKPSPRPAKNKTDTSSWESKLRPAEYISQKISDLKNLISKIC